MEFQYQTGVFLPTGAGAAGVPSFTVPAGATAAPNFTVPAGAASAPANFTVANGWPQAQAYAAAPVASYLAPAQGIFGAPIYSPQITLQTPNVFAIVSDEKPSIVAKSKNESVYLENLETLRTKHRALEEQLEKSQNPSALRTELEQLKQTLSQKKAQLKDLEHQYIRQEKANLDKVIARFPIGSSVEEKQRYINGLQEAIQRKRNNLDALEATKSNYETQATQDKLTIESLSK